MPHKLTWKYEVWEEYCLLRCGCSVKAKGKAIRGRKGPWGCETSRLPHFQDRRLTDVGGDVNFTPRPTYMPSKISSPHFCYRLSRPQGRSAAERIRSIEKSNDIVRNRTRDFSACSIVFQPFNISLPTFRRRILPTYSRLTNKLNKQVSCRKISLFSALVLGSFYWRKRVAPKRR
jgi:hypothetical protein